MIPRDLWTASDRLAHLDGWSYERVGFPAPPPRTHGPTARENMVLLVNACPKHLRKGALRQALETLSDDVRRGFFFDLGRMDARRS